MSPKKAKAKKKVQSDNAGKEQLSEVDKTFYELQIADLKRKLTRLKTLSTELEEKNAQLLQDKAKLDEDRADIIAFLKRNLENKTDEISDLIDRLQSLRVKRQEETENFQKKLFEKDEQFQKMQDDFNSEIKLLNGKLDVLEEFRIQKEELTRKFEMQQHDIEKQEERHKIELYSLEKKFIVDKDTLKKLLEQKIFELSQQFQEVTDARIASSTKRLIKENITVRNELNALVEERKVFQSENGDLRKEKDNLKREAELNKGLYEKMLKANEIQKTVIKDLLREYKVCKEKSNEAGDIYKISKDQKKKLLENANDIADLKLKIESLTSNLNAEKMNSRKLTQELEVTRNKVTFLTKALFQRVFAITNVVRVKQNANDEVFVQELNVESDLNNHREEILQELYELFLNVREFDRLEFTWHNSFGLGSLGFVPRQKSIADVVEKHAETQVGTSFEEFLNLSLTNTESEIVSLEVDKPAESES